MTNEHSVSYWKQLWRSTNGLNSKSVVNTISRLNEVLLELESGVLYYLPENEKSLNDLKRKHSDETKLLKIAEKLSKLLILDCFQTWDVLMHFLSNEYHGSPQIALKNFSISDGRIDQFVLDIWQFYNSERLFKLKLTKLILENSFDESHVYHDEFAKIIKKIEIVNLKSSLLKQFDFLVKETFPTHKDNGNVISKDVQKQWIERNLCEQVEILQLLLLVQYEISLNVRDFKQMFSIFRSHAFGKSPNYFKYLDKSHQSTIRKIMYSEIAIFLRCIEHFQCANVHNWIESIREDVEGEIIRLQHSDHHSVILLAWVLLSLKDPQESQRYSNHYLQFGKIALKMNVFDFMYQMITHPMYKTGDTCSQIVRKSIYSLLSIACDKFDSQGTIGEQLGAFELCSELLSSADIAEDFWIRVRESSSVTGIVSMWNTALEYFGLDVKMISIFCIGLAKAGEGSCENLCQELAYLPVYTQIYNPDLVPVVKLSPDTDDVVILKDHYPLMFDKSYFVKANSRATIIERDNTLIHYRTPISYWTVLYDDMSLILDQNSYARINILEYMKRVTYGITVLNRILSQLLPENTLPESLIGVCEAVFDILVRFIKAEPPAMELLVACMDTCAILVPQFSQEIYTRLNNTDILPNIGNSNLTFVDYCNGITFNSSLIGFYLVNVEQITGEYKFLNAYIDIITSFLKNSPSDTINLNVILPGLIFILREVFPHLLNWKFKAPNGSQQLLENCVNFFFKVLEVSPSEKLSKTDNLIRQMCIYSMLNLENGMTLLRIISLGENQIRYVMAKETSWLKGEGTKCITIIQTSMAILMRVLRSKHFVSENGVLKPLERLIYTQPREKDAMKIVPTVTGYMNHVFNQHIPILACRLLRLFAQEFQFSLLACLDMSPHQIRIMFLERLRYEFESSDLKMDILQFVTACVEKQPGLTETFFKISSLGKTKTLDEDCKRDDYADGMLEYMAQYLDAVSNNTSSLYSPLLGQIMGLFHALWKNNMQALVRDLREKPKFWENLCSPLFSPILQDVKAYSQILNMIGLELYMFEGKVDKSLQASLEFFFDIHNGFFTKWVEHIFSFQGRQESVDIDDEVPIWLSILTSWKDFVMIFVKYPPVTLNISHKSSMVTPCLEALLAELEDMSDNRTIVIISELFVIMLSEWKDDCFSDKHTALKSIDSALSCVSLSYDCLHPRAKRAILATGTVAINLSSHELKNDKDIAKNIVKSVSTIISSELDKLQAEIEPTKPAEMKFTNGNVNEDLQPIVLGLKLLEQCLDIYKDGFQGLDHWLKSTYFINKILNCLTVSCKKKDRYHLTMAAFDCLSAYSRGTLSQDLLHCDLGDYLWLQLLPPKDLSQAPRGKATKAADRWSASEWWKVYRHAVDFVTSMLMHHEHYFCDEAITFVGIHEDCLTEAVLLAKQTLDEDALNLVSSVLSLVGELVSYESKWRRHHLHSLASLMRNICICFHHCVTLLLRPLLVQTMIEGRPTASPAQDESEPSTPSSKIVFTLNKLLELIHKSSICLLAFSPSLLSLLAEPNADFSRWQLLVELHFGAPKLSQDALPALTFGTVMSAIGLLTRSLTYTYHPDEFQSSILRSPRSRTPVRRRSSCGSPGESLSLRTTLRSDSVTSFTSTTSAAMPLWLGVFERRPTIACLETVLAFLASQSLLAVRYSSLSKREKQLVRRELGAEMLIFHEFVRKKVLEGSLSKNCLLRKKLGAYPLLSDEEEQKQLENSRSKNESDFDESGPSTSAPQLPKRSFQDSFRVSIVRKLHLDKVRSTLSPENTSTPLRAGPRGREASFADRSPPSTRSKSSKRVSWADSSSDDDVNLLPPEDGSSYKSLTRVDLAEEDYFHFMSNLFLYICETDL